MDDRINLESNNSKRKRNICLNFDYVTSEIKDHWKIMEFVKVIIIYLYKIIQITIFTVNELSNTVVFDLN